MNNRTVLILRMVVRALITAFVTLTVVLAVGLFGGDFERKYYPVMSMAEIIDIDEIDNRLSRLHITSTKLRECAWKETEWYIGEYGGRAAHVYAEHRSAPTVRGEGEHEWTDLYVGLNTREIRQNSYAITRHSCHPLWYSESVFFIGASDPE